MALANTALEVEYVLNDALKEARILIIEDDPHYRFFLQQTLSKAGYRKIEQASNGSEGFLKTLEFIPDIVILDLMMPICNGFEYCERIRALPQFAQMPILVQTGIGDLEMHQKSFLAGATDLLTKPVNAEEFLARTRAHLERYELSRSMESYRELLRNELDTADSMQRFFMPNHKQLAECEKNYALRISYHYQSSGLIGGDVWNMIPLSSTEVMLYTFDFSGQGVFSAMQAMRYHTMMQRITEETTDPGLGLTKLNKRLMEVLEEDQNTLTFMGVINTQTNLLTYAAAGIPRPLMINTHSNQITPLEVAPEALGLVGDKKYSNHTVPFTKQDSLFMFSDALYSTCRTDGTCIDEAQAAEMARSCLMQGATTEQRHKAFHACMSQRIEASQAILADDLLMLLVSRVT